MVNKVEYKNVRVDTYLYTIIVQKLATKNGLYQLKLIFKYNFSKIMEWFKMKNVKKINYNYSGNVA